VNHLRRRAANAVIRQRLCRVGRSTGIATAQATGADGRPALTAQYTAYR
jgi:hypothetical protein